MAGRDYHLVSAYRASLSLAVEAGCTTMGFCILSAGVFRGQRALKDVLQIGVRTVVHELKARSGTLSAVHLIGYTQEEQFILEQVGAEVTEELAKLGDGSDHDLVRGLLSPLPYQKLFMMMEIPTSASASSSPPSLIPTTISGYSIVNARQLGATNPDLRIASIWHECITDAFGEFVAGWSSDRFDAEFVQDTHYIPDALFFAVTEHGSVIGTCLAWHHSSAPSVGRLHWLAVAKDHQCKGVGGALIRTVLAYHHIHHHARVYLTTEDFRLNAIHLYNRYGFRNVTEDAILEGM